MCVTDGHDMTLAVKVANKGDDSEFTFARIMPLFGLRMFSEILIFFFKPLLYMPILGPSKSAANKDVLSKIWTNGIQLSK